MDSDSDDCEIVGEILRRPFNHNPFCGVNKKLELSKLNVNESASQTSEIVPKLTNDSPTNDRNCNSEEKAGKGVSSLNYKKVKYYQSDLQQSSLLKQDANEACNLKFMKQNQNRYKDLEGPPPCINFCVKENIEKNEPFDQSNKINVDKNMSSGKKSVDSVATSKRQLPDVDLSSKSMLNKKLSNGNVKSSGIHELIESYIAGSLNNKNQPPSVSGILRSDSAIKEVTKMNTFTTGNQCTEINSNMNVRTDNQLSYPLLDLGSSDTDFSDGNEYSDSHDVVESLSRCKGITLIKKISNISSSSVIKNSDQKPNLSSESVKNFNNGLCITKVNTAIIQKPREAKEKTSAVSTKTLISGTTIKSSESNSVSVEQCQKDQEKNVTSPELVPGDILLNKTTASLNSIEKTIDDVASGSCGFKNVNFIKSNSKVSNDVFVKGASLSTHEVSSRKSNKTKKQNDVSVKGDSLNSLKVSVRKPSKTRKRNVSKPSTSVRNKTLKVKEGRLKKKPQWKLKKNSSTVICLDKIIDAVDLPDDISDIFIKIPVSAKALGNNVIKKDDNKKLVKSSNVVQKATECKRDLKNKQSKNVLLTGDQQSFLKSEDSNGKLISTETLSSVANYSGQSNVSGASCSKSNKISKDSMHPLTISGLTADSHNGKKNSGSHSTINFSDDQKVTYSRGISSSPGKYFGSSKSKTGSPGSPSKRLSKFSPYRKSNKINSPQQNSSQKVIDNYFSKSPPKKKLFEASFDENCSDKQTKRDEKLMPGVRELKSDALPVINMQNGNDCRNNNIKDVTIQQTTDKKSPDSKELTQYLLDSEDVDDIMRIAAEKYIESEKANAKQCVSLHVTDQGEVNDGNFMVNEQEASSMIKDLNSKKVSGQENGRDNSLYYYRALSDCVRNAMTYVYMANEEYLFSTYERKQLSEFEILPQPARYLYCRLLARKNTWIRKVSMKYPGLSVDLSKELDLLYKGGFINLDHGSLDLEVLLGLLNVAELKKLCKTLNLQVGCNKNQLIESLMKLKYQQVIQPGSSSQDTSAIVRKHASKILDYCAILTEDPRNAFLKCMRIFTFAHSYQQKEDLFRLVMDISRCQFPIYECKPVKAFYSLENYEEYESALLLQSEMVILGEGKRNAEKTKKMTELLHKAKRNFVEIINNQNKIDVVRRLPDFMRRYTAGNVYARTISAFVEVVFNQYHKDKAVEFYKCLLNQNVFAESKRGLWYVRIVLILFHHLKNYEMVGSYLLRAQNDDKVNLVAKSALHSQVERILNRKKVPERLKVLLADFNVEHVTLDNTQFKPLTVLASSMPSAGSKKIYVSKEGDNEVLCSVEEIALKDVKSNGYPKGLHDEGRLLKEVLLSCFWDIIYGKLDCESENLSVFFCLNQETPADWQTPFFYDRRKLLIEERLHNMSRGGYNYILDLVEKCCNEYQGLKSVINWSFVSKEKLNLVKEFVKCLPVRFIVETSRHLLKDYRAFSSGFPDLTLWNPSENKSIFVEVKGPNDVLSNTQKIWLQNIKNFGGDSTICFVEDPAGQSIRKLPGGPSGKKRKLQPLDDSQNL